MENNVLKFKDESGVEKKVYVLDIIKTKKYPDKEYIVYSFSPDIVDIDNKDVLISELIEDEGTYTFKSVTNEEELEEIDIAIGELMVESFNLEGDANA